jgi:hypothetical protein
MISFHRKDLDPATRRAECRRWGVVYIYDQNEPIDPGDTTGQTTGGYKQWRRLQWHASRQGQRSAMIGRAPATNSEIGRQSII